MRGHERRPAGLHLVHGLNRNFHRSQVMPPDVAARQHRHDDVVLFALDERPQAREDEIDVPDASNVFGIRRVVAIGLVEEVVRTHAKNLAGRKELLLTNVRQLAASDLFFGQLESVDFLGERRITVATLTVRDHEVIDGCTALLGETIQARRDSQLVVGVRDDEENLRRRGGR